MRVKPVAAVAVVFLLLAAASAQTFQTLFTFRDKANSGSSPYQYRESRTGWLG